MTDEELQNIIRYEVSKVVPQIVTQVAKQLLAANQAIHTQFVAASSAVLTMQSNVVESFATRGGLAARDGNGKAQRESEATRT